ncbi:PAS domain-containing protein [Flavobacterium sp. Sd200]|uniref:PAS domain-containing sensor histidine kinase n=1 Tax=Flavobacterium sp. Sd200 TaxID=2692211 RepID=UPI001371340B|nr:PAS domain-containing protein [Flavobacterium sp. Sd200]MXN89679.1 PAS domain-containing protein [Flavobacterium sp. Sd200]
MHTQDGTESAEAFYKKLLDEVPGLIFKAIFSDGKISVEYCSESVNELLEITAGEFKDNPDIFTYQRIVPKDRELFLKKMEVSKKKQERYHHEFRVKLPEKGLRWLRITGKPEKNNDGTVTFYSRISDITDYKLQEQKMLLADERFEFAMKASSEGVWDLNIVDDKVYFSAQLMKILGREEKEVTVPISFWMSHIHPDDMEAYQNTRQKHLNKKTPYYESVYRIVTDSGKYRWVLSRGKIIKYNAEGKPLRAVGTLRDITQIKEKEIQLGNTLNIIGDQNNRLSNFAHIVSHNLRSHASNLKMLLDLLKNAEESEREEMLEHLEGISDGLSITISHLKELVEIQTEVKNVKETLNLRHYLKNILSILHNEITKHGVTIEINIPLDVTVSYNPAYLESILLNFTTNAIKYSSSERKPVISYDFGLENDEKVLSISDNGLGIDLKKHKNSLFGMYKTFHKNQNSRGIGLFITKNQVEAMGGRIEVTSEVNKGTTFKIYFDEKD